DPDHGAAAGDELAQLLPESDHQVEREHATRTERVAVREPTGDCQQLGALQEVMVLGELGGQHDRRVGAGELERERHVPVTVGARSGDDECGWRAHASSPWRWNASTKSSRWIGSTPGNLSWSSSVTRPSTCTRSRIRFSN